MGKNRILLLVVCLGISFGVFSQGLPYFSSYTYTDLPGLPMDGRAWNSGPKYYSIPYRSPAELLLGTPSETSTIERSLDPISQLQVFSPVVPFSSLVPMRQPEGMFDPTTRSSALRPPAQSLSTNFAWKGNFALDFGLSLGMSLNAGAISYVDATETRARLRYRLQRNVFSYLRNAKLELFLQLSEIHRFDPTLLTGTNQSWNGTLRNQEPSKTNFVGRQIYITPGISISNSNLVFEGMVRVPVNTREANRTLDELWAPEIQGNLGLKYLLPVSASKN